MAEENAAALEEFLDGWDPKADIDAWKRGTLRDFSLLDPEMAYEDTVLPDHAGETYRGLEGLFRATERWLEPFKVLTVKLERIVGTGDCLVSIQRAHGVAEHTGIEFDQSYAYIWTFRDGKVVHLISYMNPADALEAAGLSE